MANAGPKTVGSLETWEPPDKSFSKHILQEGKEGPTPNDGSVCVIMLNLIGESEIEESDLGGYKFGSEVEVTIGEGDTMLSELLDKALCSMKEGEICYIKSKVDAKGNKVSEFDVNAKSVLKFNAHLKSMSRAADLAELEPDECLEQAQHHKDKGTELFKANRLNFAIKRYEKALMYLEDGNSMSTLPDMLQQQFRTLKCQCHLNLAACYLKKEKFNSVIDHSTKALELESDNVKGLFRRGQAHVKLDHYDLAKTDFQKALQIEPENKAVSNQILVVDGLIRKERAMYKKMFS